MLQRVGEKSAASLTNYVVQIEQGTSTLLVMAALKKRQQRLRVKSICPLH